LILAAFMAAILDSENAKPLARSHPGEISSRHQVLSKKMQKTPFVNQTCKVQPKYGSLPTDYIMA
jgi:hypothetical protein